MDMRDGWKRAMLFLFYVRLGARLGDGGRELKEIMMQR
jgi:hypothetical protein